MNLQNNSHNSKLGKETKNIDQQFLEKQEIKVYTPAIDVKKVSWQQAKKLGIPKSTYFKRKSS